jgi:hypothetical protein
MSDNTPLKPTQWPTRSASLNMLKPALLHEIKRKPVAENISSPETSLNFQYPPSPSSKDDTQRVLASDCSDISTNSSSTSSSSSKTRKQELQVCPYPPSQPRLASLTNLTRTTSASSPSNLSKTSISPSKSRN